MTPEAYRALVGTDKLAQPKQVLGRPVRGAVESPPKKVRKKRIPRAQRPLEDTVQREIMGTFDAMGVAVMNNSQKRASKVSGGKSDLDVHIAGPLWLAMEVKADEEAWDNTRNPIQKDLAAKDMIAVVWTVEMALVAYKMALDAVKARVK